MKLCIFESHPVQYHAPVYRELHRLCEQGGIGSVKVFYATDVSVTGHFDTGFGETVAWDEPLLEGYASEILHNENRKPLSSFNSLRGTGIWRILSAGRPDAVLLTQLRYRFDWAVYVSARTLRLPIWLRTETQDRAFQRSALKSTLRSLAYKTVYAGIERAFVIGKLNAEHYRKHGIAEAKQSWSPYCVVDRFEMLSDEQRNRLRESIRKPLGIGDDEIVLLFCGKLQYKKNPEALLEAIRLLPADERKRYSVLYVGSGELRDRLICLARLVPEVKVHFVGFKNQTELPAYYLASDIFILPSRQEGETWGLVVNEALLAGKPAIVSRHAGCSEDFRTLPCVSVFNGSVEDLIAKLRQEKSRTSVPDVRNFMADYSVARAAKGIYEAMISHDGTTRPLAIS